MRTRRSARNQDRLYKAIGQDLKHAAMQALATDLETQAHATQGQITKEQLEAESKTKQRPRKAQGPPCGLFAQTQGQLF